MPISLGTEVFNADGPPLVARGAALVDAELDSALRAEIAMILRDDSGTTT